jgi:trimethylamine--corrinoid protein Co-methyltransferase
LENVAGVLVKVKDMARGHLEILDKAEIEKVHAMSIKILGEIGVSVHSGAVRELMKEAGCIESKDGKRILIPEEVVDWAVSARSGKEILLAARDKDKDLLIPSSEGTYMANGGEGVFVKNLLTGEKHDSTLNDVIDFTILTEKLPQVDFIWTMVGATEQPQHLKEILEMKTGFEYSTKHLQGGALSAIQARAMIDLAAILAGGEKELAKRPILSAVQCTISPLCFDEGVADGQVEFAKAGIPVVAMSANIAGITSPVTLSGTIAQTDAENLASLVISQAGKKGAPFIYSSDSSPADMKSGTIDYMGAESLLMRCGCAQMGRHYGLPTEVSGVSIQDMAINLGSVQEGIYPMMIEALLPSDLGSSFGGLENALGASLEQLVIDAWIWGFARGFAREFRTDDEAMSFETIKTVVNGGSFVSHPHTAVNFRKENLASAHPEMGPTARLGVGARGDLVKKASAEVKRLLSGPRISLLSKDEKGSIDEFVDNLKKSTH